MIEISFVIPNYNSINTIKDCLNSIINQDQGNIEIIVIDDFSSDGSYEYIVNKFGSLDRVRCYRNISKGANNARKLGVLKAKGNYIAFSDSDDIWDPEAIGILTRKLRQKNIDLIVGNIQRQKENGVLMNKLKFPESKEVYFLRKDKSIFNRINPNAVAKVYRRDIIKDYDFKNVKISQDWNIVYKYLLRINTIVFIKKPIYYYVEHTNSITNEKDKSYDKIYDIIVSVNDILQYSKTLNNFRYYKNELLFLRYKSLRAVYTWICLTDDNNLRIKYLKLFRQELERKFFILLFFNKYFYHSFVKNIFYTFSMHFKVFDSVSVFKLRKNYGKSN